MCPMQWPSSSKVASVNLAFSKRWRRNLTEAGIIQTCSTCCSSNSRESLAGKPLSMAPSNRLPPWKSCRCRCCRRHPQRTSPPSAWFHQQRQRWVRPSARLGARTLARSWRPVCHSRWRRTGWRGRAGSPRCSPDSAWRSPTITPRTWVQAAPPNPNKV